MPRGRRKQEADAIPDFSDFADVAQPRGKKDRREKTLPPANMEKWHWFNSFRDGIDRIKKQIPQGGPTYVVRPVGDSIVFAFYSSSIPGKRGIDMQVTNGKGETAKVLFTQETTRPAKGRWGKPGGGKTEKTDLMDEAPESAPGDAPESGANDAPESGAAEAAAPAPKRRGRPPGSKNRKKPAIAPAA